MILSADQRRSWFEQGYLHLEKFIDEAVIDEVVRLHDRIWRELPSEVVVDDLDDGKRCFLSEVPNTRRTKRYKLNDLYLSYPEIRAACLDERLTLVLRELMLDEPVCCNTLNFEYGSQQPLHDDALYMKPMTPYNLTASWIALEDVRPDAGPMRYVPGSHIIPQYRFSTGDTRASETEMGQWHKYMESKVAEYGLEEKTILPKKGDVFIWSAYLYHGGSPILDKSKTRQSLVTHYFVKSDAERLHPLMKMNHGHWLCKPPLLAQPAPKETPKSVTSSAPPARPSLVEDVVRTTIHHARHWFHDLKSRLRV